MINLILALDQNNLLGAGNRLPWHYPADLKYYHKLTSNQVVLMGHNTFLSLTKEYKMTSLPYQKIYVVSTDQSLAQNDKVILITDLPLFLTNFKGILWVVGGKAIYEAALPYCDFVYLTRINASHQGDLYLTLDLTDFQIVKQIDEGILSFITYKRG